MKVPPVVKVGLTHLGTAFGGGLAAIVFLGTKTTDLTAIYDQLNVVIADLAKLIAVVTPIATAAYGVYRATTKAKLEELAQDPRVQGVLVTPELEAQVSSPKIHMSVASLKAANGE